MRQPKLLLRLLGRCAGWFLLVLAFPLSAQVMISGRLLDSLNNQPVEIATVVIHPKGSVNILSFTQSAPDGSFRVAIPGGPRAVEVEIRSLGYRTYRRDVLIGASTLMDLVLPDIWLLPATQELAAVTVTAPPPILIKGDTVVYDIPHWTDSRHETLEDVLAQIPGFTIGADGEIVANGYRVDKVIVNGEEVSDNGAAILTRSLRPEDVARVELRTNEKDRRLRESLLDTREFVVLDIKLKEELETDFFGKFRLGLGAGAQVAPGAYLNAFSLEQKRKIHLFAESDRFGHETISLSSIKNLGREAYQDMISVSADFSEMRSREAYQTETYNFSNFFVTDENHILGLTTRFSLSPQLDVFFGSYNVALVDATARRLDLTRLDGKTFRLRETDDLRRYATTNKVELRHLGEQTKSTFSIQYLGESTEENQLADGDQYASSLEGNGRHHQLFAHFLHERLLNERWGAKTTLYYGREWNEEERLLRSDDPAYPTYLQFNTDPPVFGIQQDRRSGVAEWKIGTEVTYRISEHAHLSAGPGLSRRELTLERNVEATIGGNIPALFDFQLLRTDKQLLDRHFHLAYAQKISGLKLSWHAKSTFRSLDFPTGTLADRRQTAALEIDLQGSYRPVLGSDLTVTYRNGLVAFPLARQFPGREFLDLRTVAVAGRFPLQPRRERVFSSLFGFVLPGPGTTVEGTFTTAASPTNDRYALTRSLLVERQYHQLASAYQLYALRLEQELFGGNLSLVLEPEMIRARTENLDLEGLPATTQLNDRRLALGIHTNFREKPLDGYLQLKYLQLDFQGERRELQTRQRMFWINTGGDLKLYEDKIRLASSIRSVIFADEPTGPQFLWNAELQYRNGDWRFLIDLNNLLNSTTFSRREQSVFESTTSIQSLFGRFVRFGLERHF